MKRSWSWREWLPNAAALTLIGVTTMAETVVVDADGPSCALVDEETARLLTERLAETDKGDPWPAVKKRILERRAAP